MVIKAMPPAAHNDSSSGLHIFFRPTWKIDDEESVRLLVIYAWRKKLRGE